MDISTGTSRDSSCINIHIYPGSLPNGSINKIKISKPTTPKSEKNGKTILKSMKMPDQKITKITNIGF